MRTVRILLLALIFLLHNSVVLAKSMHSCCADPAICTVVHCMDAGCLPSSPPLANGLAPVAAPLLSAADVRPAYAPVFLPAPIEAIWRPPD